MNYYIPKKKIHRDEEKLDIKILRALYSIFVQIDL